ALVFELDGLTTDQTYWFRHAFDDGDKVVFMDGTRVFTPCDPDTPSTFLWVGGRWDYWRPWPRIAYWNETVIWKNLDNRPRAIPSVAGDRIRLTNPIVGSVFLTDDVSIAAFDFDFDSENHNWGIFNLRPGTPLGTPVTLTFDSGEEGVDAYIGGYAVPHGIIFGETRDRSHIERREDMLVNLASPLTINRYQWGFLAVIFHCPIIGGTEQAQTPITVGYTNPWWTPVRVFLANTNNTFRGDIIMNQTPAVQNASASLFIGDSGWSNQPGEWPWFEMKAHDGMFGHPDNKVILNNASMYLYNPDDSFALQREVRGNGVICACLFHSNHDTHAVIENDYIERHHLRLGAGAVLSPGKDETVGVMTLRGSDFSSERGATLRVKMQASGVCDKFVFDVNGAVNLNGARVDIDDSALASAPRDRNTEWVIGEISSAASAVTGTLRSLNSTYIIINEIDPVSGAVLLKPRLQSTLILIR
ncbi:MAG: hypothetical protein FWG05_02100, partial [Kiritimatiellaeota bacterium]|nr:hypothetical protein [Kiritimatiellota bacterium]